MVYQIFSLRKSLGTPHFPATPSPSLGVNSLFIRDQFTAKSESFASYPRSTLSRIEREVNTDIQFGIHFVNSLRKLKENVIVPFLRKLYI